MEWTTGGADGTIHTIGIITLCLAAVFGALIIAFTIAVIIVIQKMHKSSEHAHLEVGKKENAKFYGREAAGRATDIEAADTCVYIAASSGERSSGVQCRSLRKRGKVNAPCSALRRHKERLASGSHHLHVASHSSSSHTPTCIAAPTHTHQPPLAHTHTHTHSHGVPQVGNLYDATAIRSREGG